MLKKILGLLIIIIISFILALVVLYNYYMSPIDKKSNDVIAFEVTENNTFLNIGSKLKEEGLIRNELFYKAYIKINNPNNLQIGVYSLQKSMSLKEIVDILNGGSTYNPYLVNITIKEGYNIRKIAKLVDELTDNTYDDFMNKMGDNAYISSLIEKYWFLTDSILDSKIYYPLEGYLFPETYQISSKFSVEEIIKVLLDETEAVLNNYKNDIESSSYSIHEIMTLASIIELEAGNANDRKGVSGVFYNRLKANWALGSDVTTYYAIKQDDFSHSLTKSELNDCSNKYNTRCSTNHGLPVGPIANPGKSSIEASINPTNHDYYYFVADCKGKTYLSKNSSEHSNIINKLKSENNWCA